MSDPLHAAAARVGCPRCNANNFVGKTHCWQCRAPLPPPEAIAAQRNAGMASPAVAPMRAPQAGNTMGVAPGAPPIEGAYRPALRRPLFDSGFKGLLIGVTVITFLTVWLVIARLRSNPEGQEAATVAPRQVAAPTPPETSVERSAAPDESDPIVAESKRFIERESRHAGLPEPPVSSDGKVHLRNGGSISPEQYRDAQRHVEGSPVMHTPIPPPPVP